MHTPTLSAMNQAIIEALPRSVLSGGAGEPNVPAVEQLGMADLSGLKDRTLHSAEEPITTLSPNPSAEPSLSIVPVYSREPVNEETSTKLAVAQAWIDAASALAVDQSSAAIDAAMQACRDQTNTSPSATVLSNLGALLVGDSKYQEARECYMQALKINSKHGAANLNYSVLLQERQELEKDRQQSVKYAQTAVETMGLQAVNAVFNYASVLRADEDFLSASEVTEYLLKSTEAPVPFELRIFLEVQLSFAKSMILEQQEQSGGGSMGRMQRKLREKKRGQRIAFWESVHAGDSTAPPNECPKTSGNLDAEPQSRKRRVQKKKKNRKTKK